MVEARLEAPAPVPVADGIWRPQFITDRQAYVCYRYTLNDESKLVRETHGARIAGPDGKRFCPLFVFKPGDAQEICDQLNEGAE